MDGVSMYSTESQNYSSPNAATTVETVTYQTALTSPSSTPSPTPKKKSAALARSTISGAGLVGVVIAALGAALF